MNGLTLVGEARIPGDHEKPSDARERSDDFLDHTVREIVLLRVATHVLEGQYGYGRFIRERQRRWSERRWVLRSQIADSVHPHWPRNVLEGLFAQVIVGEIKFACRVLLNARRNADAPWMGQTFETGRNIHPVTENVAVFDDDIANVDAYS